MKLKRRIKQTLTGMPRSGRYGNIWLMGLWWLVFGLTIGLVDPEVIKDVGIEGSFLPLPVMVFLVTGWTIGVLRKSWLKGLCWGLGIGLYVGLRVWGLGEWFNGVLILIFLLVLEWYWRATNDKISLNE